MSNTKFKPKPLGDQIIVITEASSGLGLATALMAAKKGAKVALAGKNGEALGETVKQIVKDGGNAIAVTTDVSNLAEMKMLKDTVIKKFGTIDTWINNASTSIYGYLLDSDIEKEKILFNTNFWGARIGSILAVEAMKENGGVLINFGSEVSVAAQPLLGVYSASKHALKAYTDALRSELRDCDIPIEVCLVRPTAIDTPFPQIPAPIYHPHVAAEAILKCAENPQRDVYVGGPARLSAILDTFFPKVKDMMAESKMKELKEDSSHPHREGEEGLLHTSDNKGRVHLIQSAHTDITTMGVLKTLKENFKLSRQEKRGHESH